MPRIGEAGAQHAFVAGDGDRAAVGRLDIGDEGEERRGGPVGVAQREVALVDPHGDLHDLRRQVHEGGVDPPEQRHRPFDQAGHLVEQAGIVHHTEVSPDGQAGDALGNDALAFVGVGQHVSLAQLRSPVGAERTVTAPGAWKRWPSVRSAEADHAPHPPRRAGRTGRRCHPAGR